MPNKSKYKNLVLPLKSEKYSLDIVNQNNETIDTELHNLEVKNQEQDNLLSTLNGLNIFLLKNQEEIIFEDNVAVIQDERITKDSIADVYFTSETISIAEKAEIYVETNESQLVLTANNVPEDVIKASIVIKNFNSEESNYARKNESYA